MEFRVAIFASGGGTNARKIIERFDGHTSVRVQVIVSNKPNAGVIEVAKEAKIPVIILERETFLQTGYVEELQQFGIDWIILAGFLWKIPTPLIDAFPHRIINIHPALLPKYGGKGMYGTHVHKAVIDAGETESGITIHYVDDEYDHGGTIFQATCEVRKGDTPETLSARIQKLEHEYYPQIIERLLKSDRA